MVNKTQFWLYLVNLGLFKKREILQDQDGFYAFLSDVEIPDRKWFTWVDIV